jgi:ATPase subunit of ABC transporter with duplicated ATPase domains
MHSPIFLKDVALSFPHKTCFEDFSIQINFGSRIAIIGRNGCGKSILLKCIQGIMTPTGGLVHLPQNTRIGYVPQIIENDTILSGGERFNKALTNALSLDPNFLLLDEPTNHLDRHNHKSLMRMLQSFPGTLIVVSHDTELLRSCIDTLWHVDDGQIRVFTGAYDDYIRELHNRRSSIEQKITHLKRQKKDIHHALMKEQTRAAKSKSKGTKSIHQRKWPTILSPTKVSGAQETSGRKKSVIENKKQDLSEKLSNLRLPEIIVPKFSLSSTSIDGRNIVTIRDGSIGYAGFEPLLKKISLSIGSMDRVSIQGDNASGKSTLIKVILNDPSIIKSGNWYTPKIEDIGYLDQHYNTLSAEKTVFETIAELVPTWTHIKVRRHLNDFLFHKNDEVNSTIAQLSGGEKVRLSLAQIAARTPKLLILDEITNNLDLETKQHVTQVLKVYPGAMIVISHEDDFLDEIGIDACFEINNGLLIG